MLHGNHLFLVIRVIKVKRILHGNHLLVEIIKELKLRLNGNRQLGIIVIKKQRQQRQVLTLERILLLLNQLPLKMVIRPKLRPLVAHQQLPQQPRKAHQLQDHNSDLKNLNNKQSK